MKRIFCDRCGEEEKGRGTFKIDQLKPLRFWTPKYNHISYNYDLCEKCLYKIINFIRFTELNSKTQQQLIDELSDIVKKK
jgi:hypothetical protein